MRILTLLGAAALLGSCSEAPEYELLISNVSLVDVVSGDVLSKRYLGIRDGEIAYIGSNSVTAEFIVSGDGRWAIPGLWDMHVHISDPSTLSQFIGYGVVGVRDMGGSAKSATDGCESIELEILRSWSEDIRQGTRTGPEIVMAGTVLSGTGAVGTLDVTSPERARAAVAEAAASGVDFLKVYEDISYDAFVALADEAHKQGLSFAGHVSEETLRAIDAIHHGQRSIEHVRSNLLLCFAESDAELELLYESDNWNDEDRLWAEKHVESCPAMWRELRSSETWLTPTLAVQETLEVAMAPAEDIADARNWNRFIHRFVERASKEELKLLAGSDSACDGTVPGHSLHRELELLVSAGLSNLDALRAATLEPAKYLEREHRSGRLEVGFDADIVLLDQNPLDNIAHTQEIYAVILDGEAVYVSQK